MAIEIIGDNYSGKWKKVRTACRAVVIRDGEILLSDATASDVLMLPGGGLEKGEDVSACCAREVAEETGYTIEVSPCALELDEYYENVKYVSYYFFGNVTSKCPRKLTRKEKKLGLEAEWLPVGEAVAIFSRHKSMDSSEEEKRGIYLREHTALCEVLKGTEWAPDKKLARIFDEKPDTWGYRGDPYFWDYLRERAECMDKLLPDELEKWIRAEYLSVSGTELSLNKDAYVEQFAHGGMSSGGLAGDWWLKTGIPLLISRLV